jgi:hypothetical protein
MPSHGDVGKEHELTRYLRERVTIMLSHGDAPLHLGVRNIPFQRTGALKR